MGDSERYTAYCGLFCRDCIPSTTKLFELTDELRQLLERLGFEHYAALKSRRMPNLKGYSTFAQVLGEIPSLRCEAPCREGGGNPQCRVRQCAVEKGHRGCWECSQFVSCELLQPLRDFHGDNINHNLGMIQQHGTARWIAHRAKHYPWL